METCARLPAARQASGGATIKAYRCNLSPSRERERERDAPAKEKTRRLQLHASLLSLPTFERACQLAQVKRRGAPEAQSNGLASLNDVAWPPVGFNWLDSKSLHLLPVLRLGDLARPGADDRAHGGAPGCSRLANRARL